MAKTNLIILAASLLLVLLFSYGITFSEGTRVLKADHQKVKNINADGSARVNVVNAAYSTDGFRPTTPGHSPGAGHSRGPTRNHKN
ncbi:hypothetical protein HRI_001982200 [Hibiscus trionum]|uniref:Uncharacterized protein n=1 Tax=Hibiscus trionum TaxID=183268 RepID=A0A9W7HS10_HIBTR|nr:hypothetical protein HRI_001982200 [Hibiscus trionum]